MGYYSLLFCKAKLRLDPPDQAHPLDQALAAAGDAGDEMIVDWCGRTFTPITTTRTFDAPEAAVLVVPDLQALTALTAYGSPLVLNTDYTVTYRTTPSGQPAPAQLRRLSAGQPSFWSDPSALESAAGAIALTALFAYLPLDSGGSPQIPARIHMASNALLLKLWTRSRYLFEPGAGNAPTGQHDISSTLITGDPGMIDLLSPFKLDPPPTVAPIDWSGPAAGDLVTTVPVVSPYGAPDANAGRYRGDPNRRGGSWPW